MWGFISFISALHNTSITNISSLQCPYNFTSKYHDISFVSVKYDNDSCLTFVSSKKAFDTAEQICKENNGHLVDLDSPKEKYIQVIFNKTDFQRSPAYWIGLKRYGGTWKWVNGGQEFHRKFDTSKWKGGKCIKIPTDKIEWKREDCDNRFAFICMIRNLNDSLLAVDNRTEFLTTQISPNTNVTTANLNQSDLTTIKEASDKTTVEVTDCANHTVGHEALQNELDGLKRKFNIVLVVLGISLLINVAIGIKCFVQGRSKIHWPHSCIHTAESHKDEEIEMAPLQESPQSKHSVPHVLVHNPSVSCTDIENFYSCVDYQSETPEKASSINETNIYCNPEDHENIYEDQLSRWGSKTVMRSNSIYGQGSCQDLYEECNIDANKGEQTLEYDRSSDSMKSKDHGSTVNKKCEDFNKYMTKSSKTTVQPNNSAKTCSTFSQQRMTKLEPISGSNENVYGIESGTGMIDLSNDALQSNVTEKKLTDANCTYSDFKVLDTDNFEADGRNVYGMESATYLNGDNKLQSASLLESIDSSCDTYSKLYTGQFENGVSNHENIYGIESASDPLARFHENLQNDPSSETSSQGSAMSIKSSTNSTINNESSSQSTRNLYSEPFNHSAIHSSLNTDIEEPLPNKKNKTHYVNTEPSNASTMAFQSSGISHSKHDTQFSKQDISPVENGENEPPDDRHTNASELEKDNLPPFQETHAKELTATSDSTLSFQETIEEESRLTSEFPPPSPTDNVPKSKSDYILMDEKVIDHLNPPQINRETSPVGESDMEGQTENNPGIQIAETCPFVEDHAKQSDDANVRMFNANDGVQPTDGQMLLLDTKHFPQSKNDDTLSLSAASQKLDHFELRLESNGEVDEADYSTSISHIEYSPSYPVCATEKSRQYYPEPITSD